jgi:hypothetical protein
VFASLDYLSSITFITTQQCETVMPPKRNAKKASGKAEGSRFEPAKIDALFAVLDAVAWMEDPTVSQIAQFAGVDPRTAGKLLKNAVQIGLVEVESGGRYGLLLPYPYKGSLDQKQAVVREALVRLPLLANVRQFLQLGDKLDTALRKAATITGVSKFNESDLAPLVEWARSLNALRPGLITEDLVDSAVESKVTRHAETPAQKVAFLSHSSKDKPFIRQLAADLNAHGIAVWLDEQRIRVGDSIPERIGQGLAESDVFVIAISANSVGSEWVKRELNNALVSEVERRDVKILPIKLDDAAVPRVIADKRYADFSRSYKAGLDDLLNAMRNDDDNR